MLDFHKDDNWICWHVNRICRHALALASKHGKHDLYLAIMVEVEGDHKEALAYMEKLPLEEAHTHASKYGAVLIQHCPQVLMSSLV